MQRLTRLVVLISASVFAGCGDPPPRGPSKTAQTQPRALDRYARLYRELLTTSDPTRVQEHISCEVARIANAFGSDETRLRLEAADDTIIRTREDTQRLRQAEARISGRSFEVGGPFCDSLSAIAQREVPLIHIPEGFTKGPPRT